MSSVPQSQLFAGSDWKTLYRAFANINFNATDPTSIAASLRQYIQNNYPEDFNDWIESSEFVRIIDLLSWLAGNLAFRTDLAARENFLETAEARESVLRLARFLSYNPKRRQPARGILKITSMMTDDLEVTDVDGTQLGNRTIVWNDPTDSNWYDKLKIVLDSALNSGCPIDTPLKHGLVGATNVELYNLNARAGDNRLGFNSTVAGTAMDFEILNGDFDDGGAFFERPPNPSSALSIYRLNDGGGNASARTGLFFAFKQGTTSRQQYNIPAPSENLVLKVDTNGITENDVWVQSLDDNGLITSQWTKVPAIFNENISFNSISSTTRDIFSVISGDNDTISIRFADGIVGTAPYGAMVVWYRNANGYTYRIKAGEIDQISIPIQYSNIRGIRHTLTLNLTLAESVSNATSAETIDEIKARAPVVYAAQGRMVSGQDYNTFPLASNVALKIKALNRIYSGQSREIDLNDPTATYLDVSIFSNDGSIYTQKSIVQDEAPALLNRSSLELLSLHLMPLLADERVERYVGDILLKRALDPTDLYYSPYISTWRKFQNSTTSSLGYLASGSPFLVPGCSLRIANQTLPNGVLWTNIISIVGDPLQAAPGNPAPVTLDEVIPDFSSVTAIIPPYLPILDSAAKTLVLNRFGSKTSFALYWSPVSGLWTVSPAEPLTAIPLTSVSIKIASVVYGGDGFWRFAANTSAIVFESERNIQWYNEGRVEIDQQTAQPSADRVVVLSVNPDLKNNGVALGRDVPFAVGGLIYYSDGYAEPRRVGVRLLDSDLNGSPDDPEALRRLMPVTLSQRLLFWQRVLDVNAYSSWVAFRGVTVYERDIERVLVVPADGDISYQISAADARFVNSFFVGIGGTWVYNSTDYRCAEGRGPNTASRWVAASSAPVVNPAGTKLSFCWIKHASSDRRVDMARTNIMDIYAVTREYDNITRRWVANGALPQSRPTAPTDVDLRIAFTEIETAKVASDTIVWHPVSYKLLFGAASEENLRMTFKVVRLANATITDGEIRSRVISAINEFFSADRWEFGETFYFSVLSAYVHQRLGGTISSFVPVPVSSGLVFGDGFEVRSRPDEMFLSCAQVSDVVIIPTNTRQALKAG